MKKNVFMGGLLIIFALCVLASGMMFGFGKWWYLDILVILLWGTGGIVFLRQAEK